MARHLRNRTAHSVGFAEIVRLEHASYALEFARNQNGAAANENDINIARARLHAVDAVFDHFGHDGPSLLHELRIQIGHKRWVAHAFSSACCHNDVGRGERLTAEAQRLFRHAIAHRIGTDGHGAVFVLAHNRTAAKADRNNVRHAEVRANAADFYGKHALAREAVRQNAQVGGGTTHVDDHGVFQAVKNDAPRMEFVGPHAMVRIG